MFKSLRLSAGPLCLFALTACGPEVQPSEAADEIESRSSLQLYVMDCGQLTMSDVSPFNLSLEEAGTDTLAVPCYLVDHPEGRLLWDLGLPLALRDEDAAAMDGGTASLDRSVLEQLADVDLAPTDIDYVAFSHLHFDHCGQAADFTGSHHLIQRTEHEAAFVEEPEVLGYQTNLYMPLQASETTLLDGDHDVFGDGRVVIKSAPGHTPGHQMLFVDLEETGPVLLSGDLYHFPANRELRRAPVFNYDSDQTLATMEAIEQFLTETGATLWIEHNAELAASQRKLPESYR